MSSQIDHVTAGCWNKQKVKNSQTARLKLIGREEINEDVSMSTRYDYTKRKFLAFLTFQVHLGGRGLCE